MKMEYDSLDIEIIIFDNEDMVVTSGGDPWEGEGDKP